MEREKGGVQSRPSVISVRWPALRRWIAGQRQGRADDAGCKRSCSPPLVGCCTGGTIAALRRLLQVWWMTTLPGKQKQGGRPMPARIIRLAVIALALVATPRRRPRSYRRSRSPSPARACRSCFSTSPSAAASTSRKAWSPELVDVTSGTRQAAAVMGGSAEITQVGFAHTMHAVGRGGAAGRDFHCLRRLSDCAGALQ